MIVRVRVCVIASLYGEYVCIYISVRWGGVVCLLFCLFLCVLSSNRAHPGMFVSIFLLVSGGYVCLSFCPYLCVFSAHRVHQQELVRIYVCMRSHACFHVCMNSHVRLCLCKRTYVFVNVCKTSRIVLMSV